MSYPDTRPELWPNGMPEIADKKIDTRTLNEEEIRLLDEIMQDRVVEMRETESEKKAKTLEERHQAFISEAMANDCPSEKLAEFLWKNHLQVNERIAREEQHVPLNEMLF